MSRLQPLFEEATENTEANPNHAVDLLRKIVFNNDATTDADIKVREQAIYLLGTVLATLDRLDDVASLLTDIRPFFSQVPKAKTAKIVRTLIDLFAKNKTSVEVQSRLVKDSIEWAKTEKRTFLRQRLEARLADLSLQSKDYQDALSLLTTLLYEVKKLDDKALLVEIHLLESRVQHALRNVPRSRAALTAARTTANSIYCPPALQGSIDTQSGILHAEEKDYKTSYSYFFESFETYDSLEDVENATKSLKYMLLCKIMQNSPKDVHTIISGKFSLKYGGRDVASMAAIADAYSDRSLKRFNEVLEEFEAELKGDSLVKRHLNSLYDMLLEQNLLRIIEPFSVVQLDHISKIIELKAEVVEKKLSQMILDKTFHGVLDQEQNMLIVFEEPKPDEVYPAALKTIENMGNVLDSLYETAQKLK
eukprot:CAMPEP_0201539742 /NCGR_PEP_ID=MMETSP0161_2-20130828/70569_1 /ASSEMBLY_ACC=CAM_ASM_000251 /TAXON_ID=180227 /ORGANISM="Neoparamoeba aestuarina, Strain SoJaBio B1-5/56/2" /LENGTH=420 /DNA_ID=CAMNT_0047947157 /DNA_START=863 /DNA_END=2125 /DNA_ORIENTATION=-